MIKDFLTFMFSKPNDFYGKPYGFMGNQCMHIVAGGTVPMFLIWFWVMLGYDYPSQAIISGVFAAGYLLFWELGKQGWRGWDTILDSAYVSIGASIHWFVVMDVVLDRMIVFLSIFWGSLFWGAYCQYRIMLREGVNE